MTMMGWQRWDVMIKWQQWDDNDGVAVNGMIMIGSNSWARVG